MMSVTPSPHAGSTALSSFPPMTVKPAPSRTLFRISASFGLRETTRIFPLFCDIQLIGCRLPSCRYHLAMAELLIGALMIILDGLQPSVLLKLLGLLRPYVDGIREGPRFKKGALQKCKNSRGRTFPSVPPTNTAQSATPVFLELPTQKQVSRGTPAALLARSKPISVHPTRKVYPFGKTTSRVIPLVE